MEKKETKTLYLEHLWFWNLRKGSETTIHSVSRVVSFLTEMRLRFDIWTHRIYRRRFYKFDALNFT